MRPRPAWRTAIRNRGNPMTVEDIETADAAEIDVPVPVARIALKTDILVIGAGQAGLSSAYHLKKLGLSADKGFVVLDQSPQAGGAWQFRWPSLTLSTVNRIHDLPGMSFTDAIG